MHDLQKSTQNHRCSFNADNNAASQTMSLLDLAQEAKRESQRLLDGKEENCLYGYELLRRAIIDGNERAWELIYEQYQPTVKRWVIHHPAFAASDEEPSYFINRAFEKFWKYMTPERFHQFPGIKPLMRAFQLCVNAVIVDHGRAFQAIPSFTLELDDNLVASTNTNRRAASSSTVEDSLLNQISHNELWSLLEEKLNSEKEYLVMRGTFIFGFKPRQLYSLHRDELHDVQEIYRIKQNVLARLRRDEELGMIFHQLEMK